MRFCCGSGIPSSRTGDYDKAKTASVDSQLDGAAPDPGCLCKSVQGIRVKGHL